jgi:hypothetical protein
MRRPVKGLLIAALIAAVAGLSAVALQVAFAAGNAVSQEIWLSGVDPVVWHRQKAKGHDQPNDFMDMFDQHAPWQEAAKQVKVFMIEPDFVIYGKEDMLSRMFADLKRRNIDFAVEMGMLYGDLKCGKLEGYLDPTAPLTLANRMKKLGAELRYVVIDEPLFFGHREQPGGCMFPIPEVARQVAKHVAEMRRIFPNLQVGDSEPIGQLHPSDWAQEIMQWIEAYHAAVGEQLAFIHVDMAWKSPLWPDHLKTLYSYAHARGIKFGIIYNGTGKDGVEWTRSAEQRFIDIESRLKIVPDLAVIQTWEPQPDHMMPDSQPGTLTNLVLRYSAWQRKR